MDFLKIYSNYIQQFNSTLDLLHQLRKKSHIEKFLKECKENPETNKLDLPSFLIMPGKYYLFFNYSLSYFSSKNTQI